MTAKMMMPLVWGQGDEDAQRERVGRSPAGADHVGG
jgi:hypothetical protein